MSQTGLPAGSFVQFAKAGLEGVIASLRESGYRTVGPRVRDGAIVYADLESVDQLPIGWLDEQDGGRYRLRESGEAWFDFVVGPHSLKNFLFPPRETLVELERQDGAWSMEAPAPPARPLAVLGVRSCDLHALRVQDRVFLGERYADPGYAARRRDLFLVAINCRRAAATCFCHSMKTGPACRSGFDLALTELEDRFVVEIGSEEGGASLSGTGWVPCTLDELKAARQKTADLEARLEARSAGGSEGRYLETAGIRELLLGNLDHARWDEVAGRCLSCANCTLVCPTCFCSHVDEVTDLTGDKVRRERSWASCFTAEHSAMSSGVVRKTTASRYRQWLTHKLATWFDQFDTSGCVGCGRCITWCPVGIDLTEEVRAIREDSP